VHHLGRKRRSYRRLGGEVAVGNEEAADRHDKGKCGARETDSMDGVVHEVESLCEPSGLGYASTLWAHPVVTIGRRCGTSHQRYTVRGPYDGRASERRRSVAPTHSGSVGMATDGLLLNTRRVTSRVPTPRSQGVAVRQPADGESDAEQRRE